MLALFSYSLNLVLFSYSLNCCLVVLSFCVFIWNVHACWITCWFCSCFVMSILHFILWNYCKFTTTQNHFNIYFVNEFKSFSNSNLLLAIGANELHTVQICYFQLFTMLACWICCWFYRCYGLYAYHCTLCNFCNFSLLVYLRFSLLINLLTIDIVNFGVLYFYV